MPTPALDESETILPHKDIYEVVDAVDHRREQGIHSDHNYIYGLRLKGFGIEADLDYRPAPQCQEPIAAYRAHDQLDNKAASSCNQRNHLASRKTVVPAKDNPPLARANPDMVRMK